MLRISDGKYPPVANPAYRQAYPHIYIKVPLPTLENIVKTADRVCSKCGILRPLEEFYPHHAYVGGRQTTCKFCLMENFRLWKLRNPLKAKETYKKARKAYERRLVACLRVLINKKKSGPCLDCGAVLNPWQMDFDHRPGETKRFNISRFADSWSRKAVLAEIAKCDLVCSNCHRNRTYRRLHPEITLDNPH